MKKPLLIFDLDDTLYDIQYSYALLIDDICREFCESISFDIPYYLIQTIFRKNNSKSVKHFGFGKNSFMKALEITLKDINRIYGLLLTDNHIFHLLASFSKRYDKLIDTIKFYDFTEEFEQLIKFYNVKIATTGDYYYQLEKFKRTGLDRFTEIEFNVIKKDMNGWLKVLPNYNISNKIIMVGDNIHCDYLPIEPLIDKFYYIKHEIPFKEIDDNTIAVDILNDKIIVYPSNFFKNDKEELGIYKVIHELI